ncbi:MAG: hypothetical protein PVSMB8_15300 [Vulcanimicrobiaceae bacterium]
MCSFILTGISMRSVSSAESVPSWKQLLDALPIVAFMARPDGRVTYVSQAWYDFTGLSAGHDRRRFRDVVEPSHLALVKGAWHDALASELPYRIEFPLRLADGTYRYVLAQATPMRENGSPAVVSWFGTLTDIDALKRGESALRESDA